MKDKKISNNVEKCALSPGFALVCTVLFVGILLSGAIYYGISSIMGYVDLSDSYYDGKEYDFSGVYAFDGVFYRNSQTLDDIAKYKYMLFGRLDDDGVIVGRDGFLFGARDDEYGYDYVRDYIGEFADAGTTDALYDAVKQREATFAAVGSRYVLVVIPNSQTVYSDKLPGYFGNVSDKTRLARLSARMQAAGESCFLDLTDAMRAALGTGQLYNNTENSLNALGAYYAYRAVCEAVPELTDTGAEVIPLDDFEMYRHITDGRALARQAGLEKLIRNVTISLSSDTFRRYTQYGYFGDVEVTCARSEFRLPTHPAVLIEFADGGEWDKILMYEYFSNTFGNVGYRIGQKYSHSDVTQFGPDVVIQFLHENELSTLIDSDTVSSYITQVANEKNS